jgi:hypothetical protein
VNPGALLVGLALAIVVAAYLARPFRPRRDGEWAVEAWVARARATREEGGEGRLCPRCEVPLETGHRFCPQCGASLGANGEVE